MNTAPKRTNSNGSWKRRDFLKLSLAAGAAMLVPSLPRAASGAVRPLSLSEVTEMPEVEMARRSRMVQDSYSFLLEQSATIRDLKIRDTVLGVLQNPAPTFMERYGTASARKELKNRLTSEGLLDGSISDAEFLPPCKDPKKSGQPFYSAPGSGYMSHHSYPGGVATHTALNLKVSLALHDGYSEIYGYKLNRDVVIASQVLHDLHKAFVFPWQADGSSRDEMKLAGTGEHHPYSVAESIYRGLPASVVVAQACAHNHPGWEKDETGPVNWIKAAAVIAGVDPVREGLLAEEGKTLPIPRDQEYFVTHLGDHDWVLTVPAAKWLIPVMKTVAQREYGMTREELEGKKFNALRNYAFSQVSIMRLYQIYNDKGEAELARVVKEIVVPA
jgi:hypothetical protein